MEWEVENSGMGSGKMDGECKGVFTCSGRLQRAWKDWQKLTMRSVSVLIRLTISPVDSTPREAVLTWGRGGGGG